MYWGSFGMPLYVGIVKKQTLDSVSQSTEININPAVSVNIKKMTAN
jgi:hypothetical protein